MNRQRGFVIPTVLIVYGLAALVAIAVTGAIAYKAQHWCNTVCKEARGERDQLAAEKREALRREAAIAVKYGEQVAATAAAEAKRQEVRDGQFAPVRARVRALPSAAGGMRVPADVVRVLDAATRAANAAGAPAGAPEAAAAAPPAADSRGDLLAGWFAEVAEIHAECRDRVAEWQTFYSGLRASQQEPAHEQIH